jgi:hypothetical protein
MTVVVLMIVTMLMKNIMPILMSMTMFMEGIMLMLVSVTMFMEVIMLMLVRVIMLMEVIMPILMSVTMFMEVIMLMLVSVTMFMEVIMFMLVSVIVFMEAIMFMVVSVIVFMMVLMQPFALISAMHLHTHMGTCDPAFDASFHVKMHIRYIKSRKIFDRFFFFFFIHCIKKGSSEHISGSSHSQIKVQYFHIKLQLVFFVRMIIPARPVYCSIPIPATSYDL